MKPVVAAGFPAFTEKFEGKCSWLYLDIRGLVTTAVGLLVDPESLAQALPWRNPDGSTADFATVSGAWTTVKTHQEMRQDGGGAFAPLTTIRLTDQAITDCTAAKMYQMETVLKSRFPFWDDLPAPAQMGVLSMAWACGPAFDFPRFELALEHGDFAQCADECAISAVGNPGVIPRNDANRNLFLAAAAETLHPADTIPQGRGSIKP